MGEAFNLLRRLLLPDEVIQPDGSSVRPFGTKVTPQDRKGRLQQEVMMIAPRFSDRGGIYVDEESFDWLLLPRYALPAKWGERWCQLLIVFPDTYPISPPIGFYLNKKFPLADGGTDPHFTLKAYHGAPNLHDQSWFWYCTYTKGAAQGGWSPSPDYREPDNLWTFLALVRETLTNDQ